MTLDSQVLEKKADRKRKNEPFDSEPGLNLTHDYPLWDKYSDRINYSTCNENTASELQALRLAPDNKTLCITAAGGRVLNLLLHKPAEIVAVDVNVCQNILLELKLAAMKAMDYNEYLAFMGIKESPVGRIETYQHIEHLLSPDARNYFSANPILIEKGIIFQGNLERFFIATSKIAGLRIFKRITELFQFDDLDAQRKWLDKNWGHFFWQHMVKNFCRKSILGFFLDDPGLTRYVPQDYPLQNRIFDCIYRYLWNNLAKNNQLLILVFFGNYLNESCMPLFLRESNYHEIKNNLDKTRITMKTGMVLDILKGYEKESFNGYSISDISSYMNESAYSDLIAEIIRTAKPGARLCGRSCFYRRELPRKYASRIVRDKSLEDALALHDDIMIHEFTVGEIIP
jgi:S-adenosylmethionine-diacylglycerol 3-amino-3-carboxypropyl transferase